MNSAKKTTYVKGYIYSIYIIRKLKERNPINQIVVNIIYVHLNFLSVMDTSLSLFGPHIFAAANLILEHILLSLSLYHVYISSYGFFLLYIR